MKKLLLAIPVTVCSLLILPPAHAAEEERDNKALKEVQEVVNKVQARYEKTRDLQADFKQSTKIEGFATPIASSGRVYIKKPGRLRWDYLDPNVEEIYVKKDEVKMYVPEHQQVLVAGVRSDHDRGSRGDSHSGRDVRPAQPAVDVHRRCR